MHLFRAFDVNFSERCVELFARFLREKFSLDAFDSICFRGLSGALIAPKVAHVLGKPLLAVRKGEHCHSNYKVEGHAIGARAILIDDLIDSGKTVAEILKAFKDDSEDKVFGNYKPPTLVAILLYDSFSGREIFKAGSFIHAPKGVNIPIYTLARIEGQLATRLL